MFDGLSSKNCRQPFYFKYSKLLQMHSIMLLLKRVLKRANLNSQIIKFSHDGTIFDEINFKLANLYLSPLVLLNNFVYCL